ncbi:MAG: hypothetical protein M1832_004022 [Thelocarpon impressellum]|nr:MAG: hypothetical protein M1832_004022 [Thelocarpon impressellum]
MSMASVSHSPLHSLRGLLRECSYLPDPRARSYIAAHILHRYRASGPALRALQASDRDRRAKEQLRLGRKAHSLLVRANSGAPKPLLKVLHLTYGRVGKRRHQLLAPLLRPDVPADHATVAALPEPGRSGDLGAWPPMSTQLAALVRSQKQRNPLGANKTTLRRIEPEVPETNIWKRPLPKKREKRIRWEFHKELLERILPPLPEAEWAELRDRTIGKARWGGPVPRRPRAGGEVCQLCLAELDMRHFTRPTDIPGRPTAKRDRPHNLTRRYMQRMWGMVFALCPTMRWDGSRRTWQVEWGSLWGDGVLREITGGEADLAMFDGVGERGNIPTPTASAGGGRTPREAREELSALETPLHESPRASRI